MSAAGPRPTTFYLERQALTRLPAIPVAPTGLDNTSSFPNNPPPQGTPLPGDGLRLTNLFAVVVSVYPWDGATLSGAGSLLCWIWNPYMNKATRCPGLDIDLSDATGNPPAYTYPTFRNISRLGMWINWLSSGVTVSGGTDILVRIDGFTSVGGQSV